MVLPFEDCNHMGCLPDQVKLTRSLNEELDQAMKDIRQFGNQGAESSRRITELESLCKKLKKENTTLELMAQSRDELIMEIAVETRLDKMGEDDHDDNSEDEDDDENGGDAAAPPLLPCHLLTPPLLPPLS
jgi:hypothetical protein